MVKFTSKIVSVHNRKTCMRLTDTEWKILERICYREKMKRKDILELIENNHSTKLGFTPSVRLFTLIYIYNQTTGGRRTVPILQKSLSHIK